MSSPSFENSASTSTYTLLLNVITFLTRLLSLWKHPPSLLYSLFLLIFSDVHKHLKSMPPYHLAYLPDSRSITIHSLILHNAFIHILLLLRQWCSVYQINSCCFAHVPPPSLSKIPMWMYCVFFFCIDCRQNPVPVHESPLDTVKSKSSAYLIHR